MSSRPFEVDVAAEGDRVVVAPHGELDVATVEIVEDSLRTQAAGGRRSLLLDLRGLSFMDSMGLCLVLRATACPDTDVELIDGECPAARLFDVAGVREHLRFTPPPR
jgi:anti-anti-sigma factor